MDKKQIIRERILFAVFIVLVVCIFITTAVSQLYLSNLTNTLQKSVSDRIIHSAKSLAETVTKEELDQLRTEEDEGSPVFMDVKSRLIEFAAYQDVLYAYFMRIADGELTYIIDNDTEEPVGLGEIAEPDGYIMFAFGGEAVSTVMGTYAGVWEGLMSAYAPMFDENGEVFAVACVDIPDDMMVSVLRQNRNIATAFIVLVISASAVTVFLINIMRRRAAEYLAASIAKTTFLSRVSHDIRTPMNAIIGLSRMSRESNDINDIRKYNENIFSSSSYLLMLLNEVLEINKIEAGQMTIVKADVNLKQMLSSVHTMIAPQAERKEIDFRFDIEGNVPTYIIGDSMHLTEILVNLLGNAVKFTPEKGSVLLKVKALDRNADKVRLEFSVIDTGIGIAEKNIPNLFNPFTQEEDATRHKYGGTGLGLAISQQLVELMGGKIKVESVQGEGSTFKFDLSLNIDKKKASEEAASVDIVITGKGGMSLPDCHGKQILVVEDNDINQMIAENMLEQLGASIDIVENGLEGVEAFKRDPEKYDLIFMDLQMPVMGGEEATRQIRECGLPRAAEIPIIAMTASVYREDIERTKAAGMNAHIGKPLEPDRLYAVILDYI